MYRLIPALLLLCSTAGLASTVYKTVDENGVVSFSDTLPDGTTPIEVLQISPSKPQSPKEHFDSLAAMRETTDRMVSDRRERKKLRAELNEIMARTQQYQVSEQPAYTEKVRYYPKYSRHYWRYKRSGRPSWRLGYRSKLKHPKARPHHKVRRSMRHGHASIGSSKARFNSPLVSFQIRN